LKALKIRTSEKREVVSTLSHDQVDPTALYFEGELTVVKHAARKSAEADNF
jgi:hypothetical protein